MQELEIAVRPRNLQETAMLGWAIGRRYFFPLWTAGLFAFVPIFALAGWVGYQFGWMWGVVVVWLLRLAADMLMLKVLSRLVFQQGRMRLQRSDMPSLRQQLRLLPEFFWKRLVPAGRILRMAVVLLEGVSGHEAAVRRRFLLKTYGAKIGYGSLTSLAVLELVCSLSLLLWLLKALPDTDNLARDLMLQMLRDSRHWLWLLIFAAAALAMSVSSVFFTAIGFAHYLNQRIVSEGWAVALDMERLAKRLQGAVLALAAAVVLFAASTPPAMAEISGASSANRQYLEKLANDKKIAPIVKIEQRHLRRKNSGGGDALEHQITKGGDIARVLVIAAVAAAAAALAIAIFRQRGVLHGGSVKKRTAASQKNYAREGEEGDAVLAARAFLAAGNSRAALAALYKGAVREMSSGAPCDSAPEVLAKALSPAAKAYLAYLRPLWERAVFAGEAPPLAEAEAAAARFAEGLR